MKNNTILKYVLKKAKNADNVIIVGAGRRGQELLQVFEANSIKVEAFFDNSENMTGSCIQGVMVKTPYLVAAEECVYIVAVDLPRYQEELRLQLYGLGIRKEDVITYNNYKAYDYFSTLDEKYYEEEIKELYFERLGKKMNYQNPVTYNEKINWEKINIKDARRARLADKYLVRDWIREKIGEKYLTKLYGVWDDPYEIDFSVLPESFVLKLNNGCQRNIIVKNKAEVNLAEVCRKLSNWKSYNFAYSSLELHYRDIVPKIICEEYLEGVADSVYEYDIFCFHGEPMYIWCIKGSHKPECQASFYDKNWIMQPFSYGYPKDLVPAPRPEGLEEMLALSRILCREFKHVRIDWNNLPDGRVLFGEMTFSTWSGIQKWEPEEYDIVFGNLI